MRPDPNDIDFIDNIKRLLGVDAKGVEALLPKLDPAVLIDLAAAVTDSNRPLVMQLIRAGRLKHMAEERLITRQRKDNPDADDGGFSTLNVGDNVTAHGATGTVKLPKAPGNTVGVMIDGSLEMIQRKDIAIVAEGVFGMSNIPDLRRMQALAGIASPDGGVAGIDADVGLPDDADDPAVIDLTPMRPQPQGPGLQGDGEAMAACGDQAMALLDQLATMLPDLRLADIKTIRKRMSDITMQMNESVGFAGRQAVAARPATRERARRTD